MSETTEMTTTSGRDVTQRPMPTGEIGFLRQAVGSGGNAGAIAVEQERAIAEVQGKIIIAQRCPRNFMESFQEFMTACKMIEFASTAFYSVPNRGSGPSIRFAEEAARCYGNFDYGHRELSRYQGSGSVDDPGKSEVEVYAWDMQKNNFSRRQITVLHLVDTKNGPKVIRDQADIDNRIANIASKQMRGRILAILSKALVAAGIEECKKTIAGANKGNIQTTIQQMVGAFGNLGVTVAMMEAYQEKPLSTFTIDDVADFRGIMNAIKEGAKVSEYFGAESTAEPEGPKIERPDAQPRPAGQTTKPKGEDKKTDPPKEPEKSKEADKPTEAKASEPKPAEAEVSKEVEQKPKEAAQATVATTPAAEPADATGGDAEGDDAADLF